MFLAIQRSSRKRKSVMTARSAKEAGGWDEKTG
jgi:hypothetical protein